MTIQPSTPVASSTDNQELAQDLRAVFGRLRRRLREEAADGDLTPSQQSVIRRLEQDGPATPAALARAEGMRPQSMATIVAALSKARMIASERDPGDGRQVILSIRPEARERIEAARAVRQDWLARALGATLTPEQQERLADGARLLDLVLAANPK